jgi:hypothetical protein
MLPLIGLTLKPVPIRVYKLAALRGQLPLSFCSSQFQPQVACLLSISHNNSARENTDRMSLLPFSSLSHPGPDA